MIEKLIHSNFFRAKTIAEVHVNVIPGDTMDLNLMILHNEKESLEIKHTKHFITSFEEFEREVPKKIPLSLILDGKGVIHKCISDRSDDPVISQVLPGAKEEDFYIQESLLQSGSTYVVISRKDFINGWLAKFTELGYFVIDVRIGPCIINKITSLLPSENPVVKVKNYQIKYDDRGIWEISKNGINEEQYSCRIDSDTLSNFDLIPFAGGVSYFKDSPDLTDPLTGAYRKSKEEFVFKNIYQKMLVSFLGVLLIILLVNFLVYDHFNKAYARSDQEFQIHREQILKLENLKQQYTQQKQLVEKSQLLSSSLLSYYADRLAFLLPDEIMLERISINPVTDKIRSGSSLVIDSQKIIISGQTNKSVQLNRYIIILQQEFWVGDVNLNSFLQENSTLPGDFEIEVVIK